MKISIITVVYNNIKYIKDCIDSVNKQSYSDIEHIIIDNLSTDGTAELINANKKVITKVVSEKDPGHIYAFNKGVELATGDVIAFLHSDDMYADENVIETVMEAFKEHNPDSVYGDAVYVKRDNADKVIRYWRAGEGDRAKISNGWMPPHTALFIKKDIYNHYGQFNTDFKISADYELVLRFLYMHRISMHYIHKLCVKMRLGGVSNSSLFNIIRKTREDYKACKIYGVKKAARAVLKKNIRKIPQFFIK